MVKSWRCFHCDEVFTDREKAAEHFGKYEMLQPACTIDITEYRRMEEVNRRHCGEDTELHRELCAKEADHQAALQREEEKGYERGLRDGRLHPETEFRGFTRKDVETLIAFAIVGKDRAESIEQKTARVIEEAGDLISRAIREGK